MVEEIENSTETITPTQIQKPIIYDPSNIEGDIGINTIIGGGETYRYIESSNTLSKWNEGTENPSYRYWKTIEGQG
ncbi:hypothetical protein BC6307_01710 [Sutcliffiella cohnii]|uniref:Uncharacterized protein n=2 Tax=Bacillaceae TaxID=186817 RepID=A0A223KL47_9BACI|nr:hypothetical protein BC6307_01710 [Sutcliffiella cohnii]